MTRWPIAWGACAGLTLAAGWAGWATAQGAGNVLTGAAAFGPWSDEMAPGVTRLIRPSDLFFTLYGHLARASAAALAPGDRALAAGAVVGHLGDESENGGWAPHLHLQLAHGRPRARHGDRRRLREGRARALALALPRTPCS